MATQVRLLDNGIYQEMVRRAGKTYTRYVYHFAGHQGYIAEAVRRTPGTSVVQNDWSGCGGSRHVYVELENGSDELLHTLRENYRAICQEKKKYARRA